MIKTAIIGASGFIGSHLIKKYKSKYPDCIGTSFSSDVTNLLKFDLRNPDIKSLDASIHPGLKEFKYPIKISPD